MKSKILNFFLIITSLFGYLEWGGNKHLFLFEVELEIFSKLCTSPISVVHPLTILPIMGQMILFFTLWQKNPSKVLTYIGIGCLGILLILMFIIGLISLNYKITLSTIPFIILSVITIFHHRKTQIR